MSILRATDHQPFLDSVLPGMLPIMDFAVNPFSRMAVGVLSASVYTWAMAGVQHVIKLEFVSIPRSTAGTITW